MKPEISHVRTAELFRHVAVFFQQPGSIETSRGFVTGELEKIWM
jgi:hypothetical protein